MRLIDADALLEKCNKDRTSLKFAVLTLILHYAPTIDAEPVVRCKNCRYNTDNPRLFYSKDKIMTYAWCSMIIDASNGKGFCNFAKDIKSEEEEIE